MGSPRGPSGFTYMYICTYVYIKNMDQKTIGVLLRDYTGTTLYMYVRRHIPHCWMGADLLSSPDHPSTCWPCWRPESLHNPWLLSLMLRE